MKPQISVVIVNYNSGSALASTLASLSDGLDGLAWEAVVVDNASTDRSERAAEGHPNVRVVRHHSNAGFAAGVNIGTAASSAPFLLVLNPDCRLRAGTGLLLLNELQRHATCAVMGPAILDPSGTLQESARGDPDMLTGLFGRTSILSRVFPNSRLTRRNLRASVLSSATDSSQPVDWVSAHACSSGATLSPALADSTKVTFSIGKMRICAGGCGRRDGRRGICARRRPRTTSDSRARNARAPGESRISSQRVPVFLHTRGSAVVAPITTCGVDDAGVARRRSIDPKMILF